MLPWTNASLHQPPLCARRKPLARSAVVPLEEARSSPLGWEARAKAQRIVTSSSSVRVGAAVPPKSGCLRYWKECGRASQRRCMSLKKLADLIDQFLTVAVRTRGPRVARLTLSTERTGTPGMGTARSLLSGRALRGPVGAFALRLLLRPVVKRPVAVDDVDRECLQRCVPDNLEAAVNDVGHVRQQCAGRKHDRILARLLHHGALNDIALLDPRMGMTIQPIARFELVEFDNDLLVGRARHIEPSDFVPPGRILCEDRRRD